MDIKEAYEKIKDLSLVRTHKAKHWIADGFGERMYFTNPKGKEAGYLQLKKGGDLEFIEMPGSSMLRNEIKSALGIK